VHRPPFLALPFLCSVKSFKPPRILLRPPVFSPKISTTLLAIRGVSNNTSTMKKATKHFRNLLSSPSKSRQTEADKKQKATSTTRLSLTDQIHRPSISADDSLASAENERESNAQPGLRENTLPRCRPGTTARVASLVAADRNGGESEEKTTGEFPQKRSVLTGPLWNSFK